MPKQTSWLAIIGIIVLILGMPLVYMLNNPQFMAALRGDISQSQAQHLPRFFKLSSPTEAHNGETTLYEFAVFAPSDAAIGLDRFVFDVSQAGVQRLDQVKFYQTNSSSPANLDDGITTPLVDTQVIQYAPGDDTDPHEVYLMWDNGTASCYANTADVTGNVKGEGMDCDDNAATMPDAGKLVVSFPGEISIIAGGSRTFRLTANAQATAGATLTVDLGPETQRPNLPATPAADTAPVAEPARGGGGTSPTGGSTNIKAPKPVLPVVEPAKPKMPKLPKPEGDETDGEVLDLLKQSNSTPAPFKDVALSPHKAAIEYVQRTGIVGGYADGTFKPEKTINRAEFTKMVIESAYDQKTIDGCKTSGFADVPAGAWFAPYVCVGREKGIIGGYPDGTFKPEQPISMAEVSKIVATGFGLTVGQATPVWYQVYLQALGEHNAIPLEVAGASQVMTRELIAEILYRLKAGVTNLPSASIERLGT